MRKLIKDFKINNEKYVFDGNSLELFKIVNEDDLSKYLQENDKIIGFKQNIPVGYMSKVVLNMSVNVNIKMTKKWKIKMYIFQDLLLSL